MGHLKPKEIRVASCWIGKRVYLLYSTWSHCIASPFPAARARCGGELLRGGGDDRVDGREGGVALNALRELRGVDNDVAQLREFAL